MPQLSSLAFFAINYETPTEPSSTFDSETLVQIALRQHPNFASEQIAVIAIGKYLRLTWISHNNLLVSWTRSEKASCYEQWWRRQHFFEYCLDLFFISMAFDPLFCVNAKRRRNKMELLFSVNCISVAVSCDACTYIQHTYNRNRLIAGDCKQIEIELTRTRFGRCPRTDRYGTIVSARSVCDDVERFWFLGWPRIGYRDTIHISNNSPGTLLCIYLCAPFMI